MWWNCFTAFMEISLGFMGFFNQRSLTCWHQGPVLL